MTFCAKCRAGLPPLFLMMAALVVALAAATGSGRAGTSAAVRVMAITAGVSHSCALTRTGGVKCWGYNGHAELGDGTAGNRWTPGGVSGLSAGVTAISAGARHTCALTSADGGVKCWGANYHGALGDGTIDRRLAPVDVSGLSGVTAISAGYDHSCALTGGGVKCWGSNAEGVLGDGTTSDRWTPVDVAGLSSGVIAISTGFHISCAVTSTGSVKCWGFHYGRTPVDVAGLSGVTAITAGGPICALTGTGGVKCWGRGDSGWTPVDVPGLGSGVTAIATNGGHGCAVTSTGSVKCWGENDHGQLGDGTQTKRPTPVDVSGLRAGVTAIAAGVFYSCAVTRAGGARCWGLNATGELGDGTTRPRLRPVGVVGFGPKATLAIVSRSVTVTQAWVAAIKVRCGAQAPCQGTLTLSAGRSRAKLGSRDFSLAAGRARTVKVKLTARGFKLLVRVKRLRTQVRISYKQPAGGTTTTKRTITLAAP